MLILVSYSMLIAMLIIWLNSWLPYHLWVSLEFCCWDTDSLSKSALFCGSGSVATQPGSILDCRGHCRYDALMKSGRERALYLQVSWQNHWPLFWCQLVMLLDLPLCGAAIGFTSRTQLIQRTDSQVASVELEDFMTHRHPAHGSQKSSWEAVD